jgi:hypothetical protein
VRVLLATDPSTPDWPNEDFTAVMPGVAVLLDGAGSPGGRETGCVHGVAWYAATLGGLVTAHARDAELPLDRALAAGISQVRELHSGTCDLGHPGTPSATVLIARQRGDLLEYLVLADSVLLLAPRDGELCVITDTRLEGAGAGLRPDYRGLAVGSPERESARHDYLIKLDGLRNRTGGYWAAAADPAAADQSITGARPVSELTAVALLSDGAGRLADRYQLATWPEIGAILAGPGPAELIRQVRAADASDAEGQQWPRSKIRDDATAVYWPLDPFLPL